MNNKGQTLVLFILLLPIIFLFAALILNQGLALAEKERMKNITKEIIKSELKKENINENQIKKSLEKNIDSVNIEQLEVGNNTIKIVITKDYKVITSQNIKVSYYGYKENNNIIIKKE